MKVHIMYVNNNHRELRKLRELQGFIYNTVVTYHRQILKSGIPVLAAGDLMINHTTYDGVQAAVPVAAKAGLSLSGVAAQTFGSGSIGFALVQLMLLALAGYMIGWVMSAIGKEQIGAMVKAVTVFACLAIVGDTAWKAISTVMRFMGMG